MTRIGWNTTDMKKWYGAAAGLRLALVLYGEWQDRTMAVKFTDVDYYVFSDAANFVTKVVVHLLFYALLPTL